MYTTLKTSYGELMTTTAIRVQGRFRTFATWAGGSVARTDARPGPDRHTGGRGRFAQRASAFLVAGFAALLVACGGDSPTTPKPPTGPSTGAISLSRDSVFVLTGDTLRLTATVRDGSGTVISNPSVTWASSAQSVATVSSSGLITVVGAGTATITAGAAGAEADAHIVAYPGSGERQPALESFDRIIPDVMKRWGIPGGAVAVVQNGRLVLARGYGYANTDTQAAVEPDALFRIASVSKPITSAAVMLLVERGELDLDEPVFPMLSHLPPLPGHTDTPGLSTITVRQLLYHSGGWNRDVSGDPMFRSSEIAAATGTTPPATVEAVIRYMRSQPLDFTPGSQYAYSNFGYALLGRVIEQVTGQTYEDFVRDEVLAPMGVTRMEIGASLVGERAPDEVRYYDPGLTTSVFPGGATVPWPDGGFHLEAMDSHGAWIASTTDLLRFLVHIDPRVTTPQFLTPATVTTMLAHPPAPLWPGNVVWYGMGWLVRPSGNDANWWHDGSLPGTTALLVRAHNGLSWVALFNARASTAQGSFAGDLDAALWTAAGQVTTWPTHDLF